jgi:membrane-bound lytic murein transglycosylase MltF
MKKIMMFLMLLFLASALFAQEPEKATISTEIIEKPWTGDLNGMIKRRMIRVLVAYNKTTYFLDKDTQRGIAYDTMKQFETTLNKKLKLGKLSLHVIFIPVSRDEFFKGLVEGRGDIAIANLTITPERLKVVDFAEPVYRNVSEIIVTGPGAPAITNVDDLAGQEVFIRESSSFYESLVALNDRFKKEGKKEVIIKTASENLETEDILEMVNAGLVKITIADTHMAEFWKQVFSNITLHPDVAVRTGAEIGWAIRQNSPQLKAELDAFIKANVKGTAFYNMTLKKYLKSVKYVKNATSEAEMKKFNQLIDFFRKYGEKYAVDSLLMVAQGYQESRLDQNAKSQVGAIGVMQVMPATGKDMKVGDITVTEPNVHAGIKYMRFMINQHYKDEPMDDLNKMLMTFASYNCGPGRMRSLRAEAEKKGLNKNVWFGNVERIAAARVGQETVTYVSNIFKYYIAYKLSLEEMEKKRKAKEEQKSGASQ